MTRRVPLMIAGIGSALPERVMTNADFEKLVDTTDEWIRTRSGIRERHIAGEGENTLTLGAAAARKALDNAGLTAADLDLVVVATSTPYVPLPATACYLQKELGCRNIGAFDVSAACSGFVYGLVSAAGIMGAGALRHALVVGAETMSSITDFEDRGICVLLGDGAGAVVLSQADNEQSGLYESILGSDGSGAPMLWIPAGGSLERPSARTINEKMHYLKMNGREVYKFAVVKMQEVVAETVARAGLTVDDLALIVPHQSNLRIIESVSNRLKIPMSKMAVNIDRCGNTSAASIPLALDDAFRAGRVKKGDWILLAGFGAGYTWASALLRY